MSKFEIKMPKLGESITEGTITTWSVKVGDIIQEDDVLFEVETAKVTSEIPSPVAGKVAEILFKEGDTIPVGQVVIIIETEGEEGASKAAPTEAQPAAAPVSKSPKPTEEAKPTKKESERWYSPVVLQLANEAKISTDELDTIKGTGFEGRLSKRDMILHIQEKKTGVRPTPAAKASAPANQSQPVAAPVSGVITAPPVKVGDGDQVIPMDAVRRIIADRMTMSKHVSPHVTTVVEVDVTKLAIWRSKNKDAFKQREGISLTYMPAIVEATAHALAQYPRVNSSVDGYNIIERKNINVGVAVSLNDGNLIVPVIPNADQLNLTGLAHAVNNLAGKARSNKLSIAEMQGGTFTITNYGSFGTLISTPIINQPEVAILGVGAIEKKPVVIETPEGDTIAIRHKMYLSLSHDHRVVDGSLGGMFVKAVADYLENWNA